MTRYKLENDTFIKPVKFVRHNGRIISNPPDELVIELGEGYPLQEEPPQPELDQTKQWCQKTYKLEDNKIVVVWVIHDYTQPEPEPQSEQQEPENEPQAEQEQEPELQTEPEQQEQQPEQEAEQPQPEPEATE